MDDEQVSSAAPRGRRILVVDDDRDAAETMAILLKLNGYQTRCVYDGLEALTAMEQWHPDAVLLDISMPKLDGYKVAGLLREQSSTVVLVAITGWAQATDQEKCKAAGFDGYLGKPAEVAAVIALLTRLLH